MGLSIYYSGRLRDPNLIDDIISESADIAESLHWNITELPSAPGIPVRGLLLQPKNCDPIWLTFHMNGNLCSPILYSFLLEKEDPKAVEEAKQVLVTYTQEAGPDIHRGVIKFFKYISEKYFGVFELNDESKFWETGDEQLCRKRFGEGGRVMSLLDIAVSEMKSQSQKRGGFRKKFKGVFKKNRKS